MNLFRYLKKARHVVITTHRHADLDAYCSVYAFSNLLALKGINNSVYLNGINCDVKKISLHLKLNNLITEFKEEGLTIILDTSSRSLLPNIVSKVVIIDHHPLLENWEDGLLLINEDASSTCEIISSLIMKSKIPISKDIAMALLIGILADSQYLTLAKDDTIRCVNHLIKYVSLRDVKDMLRKEKSYSERIARLKAIKRMKLYTVKELIIAITHIGSYNASIAKMLIDIGADLSIVETKDSVFKVSMRASEKFYNTTKIHLGKDIASMVSKEGGGHSMAASLTSNKSTIKDILDILRSKGYNLERLI